LLLYRYRNDIADYVDRVLESPEKDFGIDRGYYQLVRLQVEGDDKHADQDRPRMVRRADGQEQNENRDPNDLQQ